MSLFKTHFRLILEDFVYHVMTVFLYLRIGVSKPESDLFERTLLSGPIFGNHWDLGLDEFSQAAHGFWHGTHHLGVYAKFPAHIHSFICTQVGDILDQTRQVLIRAILVCRISDHHFSYFDFL